MPPVEPYDETLTDATLDEREVWAERVSGEMEEQGLLESDVVLVFHAGKAYTEPLRPKVKFWVDAVRIPTEGLMIGERMDWYNEH